MNQIVLNALVLASRAPLTLPAPAAPPEPVENTPPLPQLPGIPLDGVSAYAWDTVGRAQARTQHFVTGFVLTHKGRGSKCIVDGDSAAWMPGDEAKKLLQWKRPKQTPAPWVDEKPPEPEDEAERELRVLANRLGIPFNSMIPHNTGFFVPGIPQAFASAAEAIEALFERIYTVPDATVYRPGKPGRASGYAVTFETPQVVPVVITGTVEISGEIVAAPEVTRAEAQFERAAAKVKPKKPAPEPVESAQVSLF